MLLNIMYYDQSEDSKTSSGLSLGPILITREQVCIKIFYSFKDHLIIIFRLELV